MATWEDVRRVANSLPEVTEGEHWGSTAWRVGKSSFVWERPLRRSDLETLGGNAPEDGPILAARIPELGAKQALIASDPSVYFTIPHFDGYPAILVLLDKIDRAELEELIIEAWLARAPKRLVRQWESENG
ncbi:MAG TPA: MmcQ/YjbR family DNA-binding protein [Actinospica sp.]|nr:MmcQ/YjbR family DNA-binding protein [Actinospica sp.]